MAGAPGQGEKLNVFISYSRDDLKFADQLRAALLAYDFAITIDRESIISGEDWRQRLGLLIRDADTIVFALSPSSARSAICAWEAKEAASLGKRIIPILCRPLGDAIPPPELAALQYTYFYEEPKFPGTGFGTGLNALRLALNADPEWLREHTRYLRLAKECEEVGKPSDRRLLSAADIALANQWIADQPEKAAPPTALQLEFIRESEEEDGRRERAKDDQRLKLEEALASARGERDRALLQESRALTIFARGASDRGDQPTAMLLALEGLPEPGFGGARPLSYEAAAALHQAWLRNRETALAGHRGAVLTAAFSPDGSHVVTVSDDKTARVWDLRGDKPSFVALEGHQSTIWSAAFSPDGTHVVTASSDKTARVWDLRGDKPSFVALEGHQDWVHSAAFSPDGTHVVTASRDKTARVWDLRANPPSFVALEGHQDRVLSAAFSPDRTHVVTASHDKTARVWDLRSDKLSFVALEGHQDGVRSAAFSPDGTRVVTASEDKTARVWRVYPDVNELISLVRPRLSRCLSQAQRDEYGLPSTHPAADRNFIPPPTPDGRCPN